MVPMLPKLELNPDNLVYIPDDPRALIPVDLEFHEPMTLNKSMSFEAEFTGTINLPLLEELAGHFSQPQPFTMQYDGVRYEQIRTHKKKRISKKWAKRYGFREVPCKYVMENCYIQPEPFNDFTIVSDPPRPMRGV